MLQKEKIVKKNNINKKETVNRKEKSEKNIFSLLTRNV
jgi:hypothetical protein